MSENVVNITVEGEGGELCGMRLDVALAESLEVSRSRAGALISGNKVVVNGISAKKNYLLSSGDKISVDLPPKPAEKLLPEDIPLEILYEDDDVLVIDKPSGLVVHPGAGNLSGTLVNALLFKFGDNLSTIGGAERPGIVHRIDKETSGVIAVAKNDFAHESLSKQLRERIMHRQYDCVVFGRMKDLSGEINLPIGRHPVRRTMMKAFEQAELDKNPDLNVKSALSFYEVVDIFESYSHLRVRLETGRTHQVRVHLSHIGYPIAGDEVYGAKVGGKNRLKFERELMGQCLHASCLGFYQPTSGEFIEVKSPLPQEFIDFLSKIKSK